MFFYDWNWKVAFVAVAPLQTPLGEIPSWMRRRIPPIHHPSKLWCFDSWPPESWGQMNVSVYQTYHLQDTVENVVPYYVTLIHTVVLIPISKFPLGTCSRLLWTGLTWILQAGNIFGSVCYYTGSILFTYSSNLYLELFALYLAKPVWLQTSNVDAIHVGSDVFC